MENEIRAPRAGTVKEIPVAVGDRVNSGDTLVVLED
jgi:biotin carboxyl carrier protein